MVRNEKRSIGLELLSLYTHKILPIESIHDDMKSHECFFDAETFAREYEVDGQFILGIMVRSKEFREYNPETGILNRSGLCFLCRCDDVESVRVNHTVMIDGKTYYVREAQKVQGLYWRIELTIPE